ncbi:winged helix-turn-helix transcriptional regulator [Nocardia cyriacigeorgica]|uniref:Winged helix-turn-helix transcriptional regulator n=1 Tax=Nocardia cyriacigeorgica TaxID=135487 RepID=A0A6P1DDX0_9NOCA|nr:MarR family winged helix-turn-helix transcriptional regulator [Nocardia cyriacigeorgica]NEW41973.1 winged helix-turn-helix transcriptional regulator [Nocardia cyriacigeorgica]NEW46990.1 winged helix-turn-helix transcriptional regulator [Nocardia cyriacigeorgica]NEW52997.1 winged helix-turn-helix transcriptional regulator [Nocardia cyriacigeorgica]NEW57107.1 winged helix-turn-helix transcriptional regulator [Nocardia cyriacigeorgica]
MVRWLNDEEQTTWQAYILLRQRMDAAITAGLAADGLSMADYELLVPLSDAPDGCLRAKELGAKVCWEKSRLSKHLARMTTRGLVERRPVADDARGVLVRLTPQGRALLARAAPHHVALVREMFVDHITDEESRALRALSARVAERSQREGVGPGAEFASPSSDAEAV